jgi:serine/threonine protein kinase
VIAVAAAGGLLLAFGLLRTVFAPLKEKAASALTQLTRRGPTLGAFEAQPEAAAGSSNLIRGQYELSREIGAGGMGRVYEGTDRALGRRVAIKKMRD